MKRNKFLSTVLTTSLGLAFSTRLRAFSQFKNEDTEKIVPAYLKPGDTIGITCPAGAVTLADVDLAVTWLKSWGFNVKLGKSVNDKWLTYGGTDENRLADLQEMLDDPGLKAIICGKGGYGVMRILDGINWEKFAAHPKWIIGFSDITALHMDMYQHLQLPSIHSIMTNSFKKVENDAMYSLKKVLMGQLIDYQFRHSPQNIGGSAKGILVGGNLSMVVALSGSTSMFDPKGKILLLEDVAEYRYSIDRMMWILKRSGKLEGLSALLLGGFSNLRDKPEDMDKVLPVEDIVLEKVREYGYPVAFNFPCGHQVQNFAVKLGMEYELNVADPVCELREAV